MGSSYELDKKESLTDAERSALALLARRGKPLGRHAIPPHIVKTMLRLGRRGFVTGEGVFRLSVHGSDQVRIHGLVPKATP